MASEPPHGVLGGVRGPGARVRVPEDLVVPAGGADDGCRRGKVAGVHVGEDLPQGVRAFLVQVELEPAYFEHVRLLAGPGLRADRVHGHEDVVAGRIEVAEEPLVAGPGGGARRHDALLHLRVRPVATDRHDGQPVVGLERDVLIDEGVGDLAQERAANPEPWL